MGEALVSRVDGPSPEGELVRDMAKKAAIAGPVLIVVFGLIWGLDGAFSTAYGIAIVLVNFALAAAFMAYSARISVALMGAAAMFGFLIRLAIIFLAVMLVRDASWVSLVPLGITIIVTHLGLLFWEMKYVSASLAFPGLKPKPVAPAPTSSTPESQESTST